MNIIWLRVSILLRIFYQRFLRILCKNEFYLDMTQCKGSWCLRMRRGQAKRTIPMLLCPSHYSFESCKRYCTWDTLPLLGSWSCLRLRGTFRYLSGELITQAAVEENLVIGEKVAHFILDWLANLTFNQIHRKHHECLGTTYNLL